MLMDAIDQRRIEHAERTILKGVETIGGDPNNGYYWVWSGHMLKAATLLKYDPEQSAAIIRALVNETIRHFRATEAVIGPSRQNELMLLGVLSGDVEGAKKVGELTVSVESAHPFDVVLNQKLRRALGVKALDRSAAYEASPSEVGFFSDIDRVANGEATDLSDTDKFWKVTRKKRYGNTIFGQANIFRDVLEKLQRI